MKMSFLTFAFTRVYSHAPILAQAAPRVFDEVGVGAAILMTVVGMALHWRLTILRMTLEERVKDGKITEAQARGQIRFYARCAPLATLVGVGVLIAVMFDLSS